MCTADLSLRDHEVTLFELPDFKNKIKPISQADGIRIIGETEEVEDNFAIPYALTTDIEEAVSKSEVLLIPVPFFAISTFAERIAPHIKENQKIISLGKGGGAIEYYKKMEDKVEERNVRLGDTNTLPYGASRMGSNIVRLEGRTRQLITTAFPGKHTDEIVDVMRELFPMYSIRKAKNPMETVLIDYNAITHVPPMICNAGRIESGDKTFHLFGKEASTESVIRVMRKVDEERMALSEALGIPANTMVEEVKETELPPGEIASYYDAVHMPFLEIVEGPFTLDTRHLTEDIPYGLVTYSSLGDMLDVETPVTDAQIALGEVLLDMDFRDSGRTVDEMGIDPSWDLDRLNDYLMNGK